MVISEDLHSALHKAQGNLGAVAGRIRERMYAATAAGDMEKAKAAEALYGEYTYLAMTLIRTRLAEVDDSPEMRAALAAIRAANKTLQQEKQRVKSLANPLDAAIGVVGTLSNALEKLKGQFA